MKDRETKRWLLGDFVKENEIRAVEIEMAYKRFKNLAPSSGTGGKQATSSVEMDFKTWILVSSSFFFSGLVFQLEGAARRCPRHVLVFFVRAKGCRCVQHACGCGPFLPIGRGAM